jgi:DNA primase catalytic subunit
MYWLNLGQRHVRLLTERGWVKVKRRVRRLEDLRGCSYVKAYCSLARYLFPERVGPIYRLHRAYPIATDFGIDIDGYMAGLPLRRLVRGSFFEDEIEHARLLALEALDAVRSNYSKVKTVFTGRRGYQIWVLDFDWRDWVSRDPHTLRDTVWLMALGKARYARVLAAQLAWIDEAHLEVMEDLTRLFALPGTVDRRTGLAVVEVDLERPAVEHIQRAARLAAGREWGLPRRQAPSAGGCGDELSAKPPPTPPPRGSPPPRACTCSPQPSPPRPSMRPSRSRRARTQP